MCALFWSIQDAGPKLLQLTGKCILQFQRLELLNQALADGPHGKDTCSYIQGISLIPNIEKRASKPHLVYLIILTHS